MLAHFLPSRRFVGVEWHIVLDCFLPSMDYFGVEWPGRLFLKFSGLAFWGLWFWPWIQVLGLIVWSLGCSVSRPLAEAQSLKA